MPSLLNIKYVNNLIIYIIKIFKIKIKNHLYFP